MREEALLFLAGELRQGRGAANAFDRRVVVLQLLQELIYAFLSEAFLINVNRPGLLLPVDEVLLRV